MFMIPSFLLESPDERKRQREARLEWIDNNVQNWTQDIKWKDRLAIRASSFKPRSLFPVKPTKHIRVFDEMPKSQRVLSPNGDWMYSEVILERGDELSCMSGNKEGKVWFDGDVIIPRIHQNRREYWDRAPWMSITPQEIFTLRAGTRFAKGTTVIAGLGMGHQLEQVCQRKRVKKVIVVEREKQLVDWISPQLDLNGKDVEFVIDDAEKIVPTMTADAALIDIYPSYGWNEFPHCPNINKVWVWGSAKLPDRGYW